MAKKAGPVSPPPLIYHPKTADAQLSEFRRVVGSIALTGPIPSKYFSDGADDESTDSRARD
jgi:hypothetical protein